MTVFEIARPAFNCLGHAKENRSRIQNHAKAELEELFWRKPWGLAAAFEHANGKWNLSEFLPDRLQLLQIGWPLEVNAVGPGLEICFPSLQRITQAVWLDRIGPGQNKEFRIFSGGTGPLQSYAPSIFVR